VHNGDKLAHFTVSKTDVTKSLWGDFTGNIAPQLFGRGAIPPHRPMESVGAYSSTLIHYDADL